MRGSARSRRRAAGHRPQEPDQLGAQLSVVCDCCAAEFQPGLGRLRVIFVRSTCSRRSRHVRFAPIASEPSHRSDSTRCAISGPMHRNKPRTRLHGPYYSITSSARARMPGGTVRPNALAVSRLITSSNLIDCMTGRSAGFSPLRIRPVYTPAWRYASVMLVP
jgi:hypothetical protein